MDNDGYKILTASADFETTAARELEKKVNEYLCNGWTVVSEFSMTTTGSSNPLTEEIVMAQAVIKK